MMKRILASCVSALLVTLAPAQHLDTTRIVHCSPESKAAVRSVRLTGQLKPGGNGDFRQLRDICWQLEYLDLSASSCEHIPNNAFHSRHRLRSVALPKGLKKIGSQAFFACDNWQDTLRIPLSVTHIGTAAFSGCTALTSIELPADSLKEIGDFAFAHCTGLRTIRIGAPTPPLLAPTAFAGIDLRQCTLIVPHNSKQLYQQAPGWCRFFSKADKTILSETSPALIPLPTEVVYPKNKPLRWKQIGRIEAPAELENECARLKDVIRSRCGINLSEHRRKAPVRLSIDASFSNREAYTLDISNDGIRIAGGSAAGVFWGIMTLDQLLATLPESSQGIIPSIHIADCPRTELRELMVDPARTFIPLTDLKKFVEEMARYKFNSLHLHLVDDQAWRVEIKQYPLLTSVGSKRIGMDDMQRPVEGFYTQDELKELVAYAARFHVDIVPEIEMPGHEVAAIHCYPQLTCGGKKVPIRTTCGVSNDLLCPGEEFVYEFLGHVFAELAEIFPSRYVHLGGDEAGNPPLDCWTECNKCKDLKRRLGLARNNRKDNWQLQKYMFDRIIDTLRTKHGKTPMFWYETDFREIQSGCVTFAWRHGLTQTAIEAALANNARIVLCPGEHCYLDYPMAPGDMPEKNWGMPVTSLRRTYELDPSWGMAPEFEQKHLLGIAGTLWSECIDTPERLYYQAYPRALALAEAGWSQPTRRSWPDFIMRLRSVAKDMLYRGISLSLEWE